MTVPNSDEKEKKKSVKSKKSKSIIKKHITAYERPKFELMESSENHKIEKFSSDSSQLPQPEQLKQI